MVPWASDASAAQCQLHPHRLARLRQRGEGERPVWSLVRGKRGLADKTQQLFVLGLLVGEPGRPCRRLCAPLEGGGGWQALLPAVCTLEGGLGLPHPRPLPFETLEHGESVIWGRKGLNAGLGQRELS